MTRLSRKRQPTPKSEATKSLGHARTLLQRLEEIVDPGQEEYFVNCLNDFLRAARTVPEFLPKESGHAAGLKPWTEQEIRKVQQLEGRFERFITLRRISTHDCNVQPDRGDICVEAFDKVTMAGSFQREVRDAVTARLVAHEHVFAPPEVETTLGSTRVAIKYYFADWPQEDIVTFCGHVLRTLEGLVGRAYSLFP